MKEKTNIAITLAACVVLLTAARQARAEEVFYKEYEIKAVFMYQFVNFIDGWRFQQKPGKGNGENESKNEPILLIGIIGKSPFQDAFVSLKDKQIKGRKVVIRYFRAFSELDSDRTTEPHPQIKQIKQCDLLFVCPSECNYIDPIRHERILTIGDTPGFLERGGIINFITEQKKVRFEINTAAAHRANLEIRSKLLRLAKRVLTTDNVENK
ncbi:MAG: YfiR family protein [Sedimentisphaerales bacterium]|jgi:hypothetical protein